MNSPIEKEIIRKNQEMFQQFTTTSTWIIYKSWVCQRKFGLTSSLYNTVQHFLLILLVNINRQQQETKCFFFSYLTVLVDNL